FVLRDGDELAVGTDRDAASERGETPAEADHVVVGRPFEKGVVSGVIDHEAASVAYVRFEGALGFGGPSGSGFEMASVEIIDYDVVAGEVGELGVGGDVDGEMAGAFEDGLDG